MEQLEYYSKAREYLLSFDEISEEMIDRHLEEWQAKKPEDMKQLFRAFLHHAQNRQGMPNSIGDINQLGPALFGFDHRQVARQYTKWEDLFDAIESGNYQPPGRFEKDNTRSYWVIYCKAILSIANFLEQFDTVEEFDQFVEGFLTNPVSRLALPLVLQQEVDGFGFALACDLLKESGYPHFVKPDTHLNDIARGLGITASNDPYQIFKDVEAYCQRTDRLPYEIDKLFWLVGSGRFYLDDVKVNTSKREFLERTAALG